MTTRTIRKSRTVAIEFGDAKPATAKPKKGRWAYGKRAIGKKRGGAR